MNILFIGDVVGQKSCANLREKLPLLKKEYNIDTVIVNGENSADGNGITPVTAKYLLESGADVITTGNHCFRRKEMDAFYETSDFVIRPANFPDDVVGKGYTILDHGRYSVCVINLMGVVFMQNLENPFHCIDRILSEVKSKVIIVDFHAEATAEKKAMGFYVDGRVSAIFGTHTHTQTNDNQILPNGTGYVTDIGMTGPYYSVLGVAVQPAIQKLKTGLPTRFINEDGVCTLEGCLFEIDEKSGKTVNTKLIRR